MELHPKVQAVVTAHTAQITTTTLAYCAYAIRERDPSLLDERHVLFDALSTPEVLLVLHARALLALIIEGEN